MSDTETLYQVMPDDFGMYLITTMSGSSYTLILDENGGQLSRSGTETSGALRGDLELQPIMAMHPLILGDVWRCVIVPDQRVHPGIATARRTTPIAKIEKIL